MARESWLTKVRSAMSSSTKPSSSSSGTPPPAGASKKGANVGILAFEVSSLVSKLLHLWRAVGDNAVARLRHETLNLDGVRKVVSDDDAFLLGLARAELVDALRAAADAVAALAARCADPCLHEFRDAFLEFAETGRDRYRWAAATWKEMDARARKMDKQVASTTGLRRAMEELVEAEHGLRKFLRCDVGGGGGGGGGHRRSMSASKISVAAEQQQLIFSKKQDVKHLKQTSLWGCTFDAVVSLLARTAFTVLARIKLVFGDGGREQRHAPLHRSLTLSSAVHPSIDTQSPPPAPSRKSMSMEAVPFDLDVAVKVQSSKRRRGFFEYSSATLVPPAGTLGAAALAPRYAGLVISIERMARSPQRLVGPDERDDLYGMLTASVRAQLRARLRGAVAEPDAGLATEWRDALGGILEWLAPMAHATVRWQAERSFEQRKTTSTASSTDIVRMPPRSGGGNTFLLQTLQFADRDKVEAAVAELLVGLNYVWRFEKEMSCRALFAAHRQLLERGGHFDGAAVDEDTGGNCRGGSSPVDDRNSKPVRLDRPFTNQRRAEPGIRV